MAYDEPGYRPPKPKMPKLPRIGGLPRLPNVGPVPLPPPLQNAVSPNPVPNAIDWRKMIESDPLYQQEIADIGGISSGDRARTLAGLRQALIRYGGAGLAGIAGKLGPGWEDLLDPTTLEAAGAGDTAGTSIAAQLAKAHAANNLALQDVLAAKGILSSGQTGFELGEERQRHTIAQSDAVNALLDFLSGLTGGFAGRESERVRERSAAGERATQRAQEMGLEPAAPPPIPNLASILRRPNRPRRRPGRREE